MSARSLVLEAARDERRIKVSVYEKGGGIEGTLRPYEDRVVAWDQVEGAVSEITALLNRANKRGKVTADILQSLRKSGQLLFDLLITPKAAEKVAVSTSPSLLLSIDDKLVQIPWELLHDGRQFFCRRFAMGRVVSTSQTPTALSRRSLSESLKVLVLADPRQDLKASYQEGIDIRDLLDQERETFHVDFKSAPIAIGFVRRNLRDYDIVHYAGHADYDTLNPAYGGWLLSDGRLKAEEISAMGGLQAMPFLVFSNACQSGQSGEWRVHEGYGQEIFGLANAYLMAGVQHYIGTFWEILDEPSSYFAKQFYVALAQGRSVGESVRQAREKLIEDFGEETIVWASYMLYGDPTYSFVQQKLAVMPEADARQTPASEWSQELRGRSVRPTAASRHRHRAVGYASIALLAIALGLGGIFWVGDFGRTKISGSGPVPATSLSEPSLVEQSLSTPRSVAKLAAKPVASVRDGELLLQAKPEIGTVGAQSAAVIHSIGESPGEKTEPRVTSNPGSKGSVAPAPLTLRMNIIGQRKETDGSYTEVLVNEGAVLRSRDNFQVHAEVNHPSYVYVLIYDSQGRAGQLFPDAKIDQPQFIQPGDKIVIPGRNLWFWLDDETGTETIYVLASEKPMTDIRTLLAQMEAADDSRKRRVSQDIKVRIGAMQRGVGGITKGHTAVYELSDGRKIQKVTDVVTGTASVVRAISFQHR